MGLFDNAVEVVINNKVVQSIKTLNGGVLYEKGNGTFLTIDVPLNLIYSDAFNITGTLKDSNHTGVVGETVKLKVGSTVVDSATTTTGGAYSFTQTPVATGNHSFQVVYEGSNTYNASESTIVNRVVGKETTVLSVTSPVDNYMTYDNSITFAGTLTDDDGTILVNKTINIKEGNNTVTYTTTDSNGAFSTGLYSVSTGTHNFSIVYEGDSNYTTSSVSRTVIIREHDYAISISADKPILSYSDGESCTVTAVLTDNSVFVAGETLSYSVKHGSTVLDSGSAVTDANGSISFSYTATGVGDVTVEVSFGILLQEIFVLWDTIYHDEPTSDTSGRYSKTHCSLTFDNDKLIMTRTENGECYVQYMTHSVVNPVSRYKGKKIRFECDIVEATANSQIRIYQQVSGTYSSVASDNTTSGHLTVESTIDENATSVLFRITSNNLGTAGTCSFRNIKVYSVPAHAYALSVASTKDILSYADHESATLTATLKDGGVAVAGETLNYVIKHGSTTISTGSDTTDSNGQISFTYASTGVGDVTVEVDFGILLQEIYEVQDLYLYDPASSSSGLTNYASPIPLQSNNTNCQIEYDSTMNAYKVTDKSSSIKGIPFDLSNLPSSIVIEADLYVRSGTANSVIGIFGGTASNGFDYFLTNFENWLFAKNIFTGTTQSVKLSNTSKTAQWVHLTVTNSNGSVTATFSQNDTTIVTDTINTNNISQYGIATGWGNGYYAWIKNIKVKAL